MEDLARAESQVPHGYPGVFRAQVNGTVAMFFVQRNIFHQPLSYLVASNLIVRLTFTVIRVALQTASGAHSHGSCR